jgi:hypothetical protein
MLVRAWGLIPSAPPFCALGASWQAPCAGYARTDCQGHGQDAAVRGSRPPLGSGLYIRFSSGPVYLGPPSSPRRTGRSWPQPGVSASVSASASAASDGGDVGHDSNRGIHSFYLAFCMASLPSLGGACRRSHTDMLRFTNTPQLSSLHAMYIRAWRIFLHGPGCSK